ncbi:MAG: LysM peptidoglycan-binding domain-containing protein [Bariatricus sp.]|nr:LysM peptidoglycan-binding domain-containing protein [Bariatricus sp.]
MSKKRIHYQTVHTQNYAEAQHYNAHHSRKGNRIFSGRLCLCMIAVIITFLFSFSFGSFFSSAHDSAPSEEADTKYFKSIQIERGDTLWGIAETYRTEDYETVHDYMDEIIRINGIKSSMKDHLQEGDYLTIVVDEL